MDHLLNPMMINWLNKIRMLWCRMLRESLQVWVAPYPQLHYLMNPQFHSIARILELLFQPWQLQKCPSSSLAIMIPAYFKCPQLYQWTLSIKSKRKSPHFHLKSLLLNLVGLETGDFYSNQIMWKESLILPLKEQIPNYSRFRSKNSIKTLINAIHNTNNNLPLKVKRDY